MSVRKIVRAGKAVAGAVLPDELLRWYSFRFGSMRRSYLRHPPRPILPLSDLRGLFKGSADGVVEMDPIQLLTPARFDLPIKVIYTRHWRKGRQDVWAKGVYLKLIKAWNGFFEDAPRKSSAADFVRSFEALLESIGEKGFRKGLSSIPLDANYAPIHGSHRIAAAIGLGKKIFCRKPEPGAAPVNYSSFYFQERDKERTLSQCEWDAMALEYTRLRPDTRIALIFPPAPGKETKVEDILAKDSQLVYMKESRLTPRGRGNLARLLHGRIDPSSKPGGAVRVIVLQTAGPERLLASKAKIRRLYAVGDDSIHITGSHPETVLAGEALLNENSVAHLNEEQAWPAPRLAAALREWAVASRLDPEDFCVVMDPPEVVWIGGAPPSAPPPGIGLASRDRRFGELSAEQIVLDPRHHFHHEGIKFAALPAASR